VVIQIHDHSDPRVAVYRNLRDVELRKSLEAEHGVFVVEGLRSVRALLESPFPVISFLLTPSRLTAAADIVESAERQGSPVYVAGSDIFDGIAGFHVHRGVLALAERLPMRHPRLLLAKTDAVVIVEGVNDHENLGAIFRNSAALGAGAVLLDPHCSDPLYRRSVRVSLGHVLRVPFTRLTEWPGAISDLQADGFTVVALDPGARDAIGSMTPLTKVALMVGSEGDGLSEAARRLANRNVRIPLMPGVDSLNVATALAIGLQRLVVR